MKRVKPDSASDNLKSNQLHKNAFFFRIFEFGKFLDIIFNTLNWQKRFPPTLAALARSYDMAKDKFLNPHQKKATLLDDETWTNICE